MERKTMSRVKKTALCVFLAMLIVVFSSPAVMAAEGQDRTSIDASGSGWACCQFWWSFHVGITVIDYEFFKKVYYNIIIDWEIRCYYYWSFVFELGFNGFKWDIPDMQPEEDVYVIWNFNPTIRRYLGKGKMRPFISVGPGIYAPKYDTARVGIKGGLGIDFQLSDRIYFELGGDYHHIFFKEEDAFFEMTEKRGFLHFHGGFIIRLK